MTYALLFFGQGLNFLIAVINIRAASRGLIACTVVSDVIFSLVSFILIHHIAVANTWMEMGMYAAGGGAGSALAIVLTRKWDMPDGGKRI